MSESCFTIKNHVIAASHIREYWRGAQSPSAALKLRLAVKQYIPKSASPLPNAVTILTANAIGFPKETYEPLWDMLLQSLPPGTIRAIWATDTTHQGASAMLNDGLLGDDNHWWDHSRDLLGLVNHFASEMPQPIMGMAHSMGCAMLLRLALLHSRLMCGLIMIEPVVQDDPPPGPNNALGSSLRPDWWPDRASAEKSFRDNKLFRRFDPAVLNCYLSHAFRELPTPAYPNPDKGGVTLTTSKAQEAWSYLRGNFVPVGAGIYDQERNERLRSPELDGERRLRQFHRAEMTLMNRDLLLISPRTLWIFAEKSHINLPPVREEKMKKTGTGLGGNGGVVTGGTQQVIIPKASHLFLMENPKVCAEAIAPWLLQTLQKFEEEEKWHKENDRGISKQNMTLLSDQWMKQVRKKENTPRPANVAAMPKIKEKL